MEVKTYVLNDNESKSLLDMADDCIDRGMVAKNYDIDKINDIINDSHKMYGEFKQEIEIEIEVRLKRKV